MQNALRHIVHGKNLSDSELHALEQLVAEHPYSAHLQSVLAKAYQQANPAKFDAQLKSAAIRVLNRKALHDFIFSAPTSGSSSESKVEEDSMVSEVQPSAREGTATPDLGEVEDPSVSRVDPLDQQLIAEALGAGAALDLLKEEHEAISSEEVGAEENQPTGDSVDKNADEAVQTPNEDTGEESADDSSEEVKPTLPSKMSLSAWMNELQMEEPASSPAQVSPDTMDIVNHFIENESSLVPQRASFYSPTKAAKESLVDHDDIVSETLAKVYEQQGNIPKAISTYEKLSLSHPEKSAYFAGLIEALQKR